MNGIDLSGHKFGRLTVIKFLHVSKHRENCWLCRCDCGQSKVILYSSLAYGRTKSCGCLQREIVGSKKTHGMSLTPEYICWGNMIQRCTNKKFPDFKYYGGRGIRMCERWRKSFTNFYKDMGPRPKGKSIDRINPNGNYEPSNCRWATTKEQNGNKRSRVPALI